MMKYLYYITAAIVIILLSAAMITGCVTAQSQTNLPDRVNIQWTETIQKESLNRIYLTKITIPEDNVTCYVDTYNRMMSCLRDEK